MRFAIRLNRTMWKLGQQVAKRCAILFKTLEQRKPRNTLVQALSKFRILRPDVLFKNKVA